MFDSIIAPLLTESGHHVKKQGATFGCSFCPTCGQSSKASNKLNIFHSGDKERWKCQACGDHGDVADMIVALKGLSLKEALKEINQQPGVNIKFARPLDTKRQKAVEEVIQILLTKASTHEKEGLAYLTQERAISPVILEKAVMRNSLRFLPGGSDWKKNKEWLEENVGRPLLEAAGLWRESSKVPSLAFRSLLFFLPKQKSFEGRSLVPKEGMPKSLRYGNTPSPYWWSCGHPSVSEIHLTEGFIDLLSATQMCPDVHVVGFPGTGTGWNPNWLGALKKHFPNAKLVSRLDNDKAGDMANENIGEFCLGADIVFEIRKPLRDDLNKDLQAMSKVLIAK